MKRRIEPENKICSFFGHRDFEVTCYLIVRVMGAILEAVNNGCRTFYFGGYGEFDRYCHSVVSRIKKEMPKFKIKRVYCVPREEDLRKDKGRFKRGDYEEVIYLEPSFDGWYKSIYFRNCAMIDKSDYVIFYAENREDSGAYKAYKYAKKKKDKVIMNLWEENKDCISVFL